MAAGAGDPFVFKEISIALGDKSGHIQYTEYAGQLYFPADDGVNGVELWTTDGTPEGTALVKSINPVGDAEIDYLTQVDDMLYFFANDGGIYDRQLWRTDGTDTGTSVVNNEIFEQRYILPANLVSSGTELFFTAASAGHGRELWASNGTGNGTRMVLDIQPGPPDGEILGLVGCNSLVYFLADDDIHDRERWRSDGTPEGTYMVLDIHPTLGGGGDWGVCIDGLMFGNARAEELGSEPWISDGTADGTRLLKDLDTLPSPFHGSSSPSSFVKLGSHVVFRATTSMYGLELWRTDATEEGTLLVKDINPLQPVSLLAGSSVPEQFVVVGDTLFFVADDGTHGPELWKSDGSEAGTALVKDIAPSSSSQKPRGFVDVNGIAYFNADDDVYDRELWRSNGTEAGTVRLTDINPAGDSSPGSWVKFNGLLLFSARQDTDRALWALNLGPWVESIERVGAEVSNAAQRSFRVTFSEAVSGVDAADFEVVLGAGLTGASVLGVTPVSEKVYTVTVAAGEGQGTLGLRLVDDGSIFETYPEGLPLEGYAAIADGGFEGTDNYQVDRIVPTAQISSEAPDPTDTAPIRVFAAFSEPVTGLALGGISTQNATASNLTGSGTLYQFDLTPLAAGELTVQLPLDAAQDAAGNGNTASNLLTRTFLAPAEGEGEGQTDGEGQPGGEGGSGGEGTPEAEGSPEAETGIEGEGEGEPIVATGACCFNDGQCQPFTKSFCASLSGTYHGDGTACVEGLCPVPEGEGEGEGSPEAEGEGDGEGDGEGPPEGEGEGTREGDGEGHREGEAEAATAHTADWNGGADGRIDFTELLRLIQFFNAEDAPGNTNGQFYCGTATEDGYDTIPGETGQTCTPHALDYNPQNWEINLSELLRAIQFYNANGYHFCNDAAGEGDGYCAGPE